jgi:Mg2+ and Co2+ transporter CorA
MLPYIAGALILGVGAYLLDDASTSNRRARRDYDDACDEAEEWVEHVAFHAQKKDSLDKLFKMKKAKRKVADAIYAELKKVNSDFNTTNQNIKASKKALSGLFDEKKATEDRIEKRKFQNEINRIQALRKEFFEMKDMIVSHQKEIKERLKLANQETRMIQEQINQVLDR